MAQAVQEKRIKTSDSFEMIPGNSQPVHLLTQGNQSKLANSKGGRGMRGLRESQDSNQRSAQFIGEKSATSNMASHQKDASILTNYQQK